MANDVFKHHKGSTYLKKDNSLRKRFKCVKITRYVEQTLGKKIQTFGMPPALKRAHGGCTRGVCPLAAGFEGVQPLIVVLMWLLHGHRLHQFVSLGGR